MIWRRGVWPMLRTMPNDTHASLQQAFGPLDLPSLQVDGAAVTSERVRSVAIDGTLAIRTRACATPCADGDGALGLVRTIFPTRDKDAIVETIDVTNLTRRRLAVTSAAQGLVTRTDPAKGVDGEYVIEASADRAVDWALAPNETRSYAIVYSARRAADPAVALDAARELDARKAWVAETNRRMILETPDPVLDKAFAFAKVRATESIFATKGGLMHGPGGGRYYAAIWANDQAEYANPFFGYLGEGNPRASALNAFRHFARFMNPGYTAIPSSIIAEGTGTWNGAKDRGDQAMIAYGASRFALASGDRAQAEELWPLIDWCLEYLKRKTTADGVIASDSDELENRFPAGKANLNTSSLTYDALLSAAMLGESLGKPKTATDDYRARAAALRTAIARHFDATIDGFDTYRYYDGNTTLRAWIATPLTVGIYDRARGHDRRAVLAAVVDEGRPGDGSGEAGLLGSLDALRAPRRVRRRRHRARDAAALRLHAPAAARRARAVRRRGVSRRAARRISRPRAPSTAGSSSRGCSASVRPGSTRSPSRRVSPTAGIACRCAPCTRSAESSTWRSRAAARTCELASCPPADPPSSAPGAGRHGIDCLPVRLI